MIASAGPATASGNTFTFPVFVPLNTTSFQDTKHIFGFATGFSGDITYWEDKGTWTTIPAQPPVVVSVTPVNGTGTTQTFTAVFFDPAGSGDLKTMNLVIGQTTGSSGHVS